MVKNDGGPAFPHNRLGSDSDGMTLRDYFAAMAMQGIVASQEFQDGDWTGGAVATQAYELADEMLVERGKP